MKILLMCGAGASSGFMAQAMRKAAKEQGIENFEIIARSEAEMMNNLQGTDLVMFGPHLAFKREALEKDLKKFNIPFAFIDKDAYGSIDGAATLKQALDALREVKKPVEEISVKEEKPTQSSETSEESVKGFMGWITKSLAPKLDKLTQNIYISAIQQSIMSILPMIMIGSVSSIVGVFRNFEVMSWIPDISMLNTYSFGLIAVFLAILVPMKVLEKRGNEKLKISAMLTSLALFFIITLPVIDGKTGTMNFIMDKIGTGGMLTAVVTSVFTAWIFNFASRHSMFKEDTVMPDMVVAWMDALVPVTITLAIGLFIMSTGFDLPLFIRGLFAPISSFGQTWLGLVMICFFTCFLYSFGFTWILFPIAWAIWMEGMDANMAAVAAGQAASSINLMETVMGITYIGGQGCTLALVLMCMRSKVKKLKSIGRVCIFPAIFNINEPIVFGAPVVWNPILMIPLCLNSIIIPSLMYLVMRIGLVPIPSAPMQMWYLPNIVQGYLTTNSMSGVILVIALFAVSWLIWMPFFRVFEKQQYKEELENRKEREII
ncbi:MAG: PTS transporter subunit EIIC [[Clostridium] innocuum]